MGVDRRGLHVYLINGNVVADMGSFDSEQDTASSFDDRRLSTFCEECWDQGE